MDNVSLGGCLYPSSPEETLRQSFIGRSLREIPTPAIVLDRAVVGRNCKGMLEACKELGVDFRGHIKSHKTREITHMQVGDEGNELKIIVSTVAEAEFVCDYLLDQKKTGKNVNVLYGVPFPPSLAQRLATVAAALGPGSVSAIIDHPSQLQAAHAFKDHAGFPLQVFVKIDTGYHRAGVGAESKQIERLMEGIATFESMGCAELIGFYSHAGHSYAGDSESAAMKLLLEELIGVEKAANKCATGIVKRKGKGETVLKFTLSVGSTPTTISIQNISTEPPQGRSPAMNDLIDKIQSRIKQIHKNYRLEVHAGVYPLLDLQQLATQVGPSKISLNSFGQPRRNTAADIAITILAEISSIYDDRKPPEALIAAGTLALGREPCKAYAGWGIVGEWGLSAGETGDSSAKDAKGKITVDDGRSGWQVGKISQEHGILTKDTHAQRSPARLQVGQKVRIWPNHACVAGAGFGWYVVVDSDRQGQEDEIVDIWVRCRGW